MNYWKKNIMSICLEHTISNTTCLESYVGAPPGGKMGQVRFTTESSEVDSIVPAWVFYVGPLSYWNVFKPKRSIPLSSTGFVYWKNKHYEHLPGTYDFESTCLEFYVGSPFGGRDFPWLVLEPQNRLHLSPKVDVRTSSVYQRKLRSRFHCPSLGFLCWAIVLFTCF